MATDTWYVREMLSDVPPEELHAALHDENWDDEMQESEEGDEYESDEPSDEDPDYNSDDEVSSNASNSER